jgi:hypothetical protein
MTQSLLNSWQRQYADFSKYDDSEAMEELARRDFLTVLNREKTETTDAMQKGIDFENMVYSICNDEEIDTSGKWFEAASHIAREVSGGLFQFAANKVINIGGRDILLYGRLDCLKAGVITDIKFSSNYSVGKFYKSPQHPMYFEIVPEADKFVYLVSNGRTIWREEYRREETKSIIDCAAEFLQYLDASNLMNVYIEKWRSKDSADRR